MTQRRSLEDYLPGDLTIDDFVTQGANRTYFDRREALAYLLLKRHVVPISGPSQHYAQPDEEEEVRQATGRTSLLVNTSDFFTWGYSDAEHFRSDGGTESELYELLKFTLENPKRGSTKWACVRWQEQPQAPIVHEMIKEAAWDETMRALPPNSGDADCCEWHRELQVSNVEMDTT